MTYRRATDTKISYLDFEQGIAELEKRIEALQVSHDDHDHLDISKELEQLEKKNKKMLQDTYNNLTAWQISQVARHPQRPYTLDYISHLFTDFEELHGDRAYADDPAIVGGLARLDGMPVMVIGHQKGRDVKERQYRNFGMPRPEGYRKALRLFKLAEKFGLPIITLIDTPGAYPGIGAEERGQSEAIARNLYVMSELKTPIIGVVIGEGGSGGALALGVVDQLIMLQYSTYSVISPEGCASILWKSASKAPEAAETLGITADRLKGLGLVDVIVTEPLGGAHRDIEATMKSVRNALKVELAVLQKRTIDKLLAARYERLMGYGKFKETASK
jgi:acetyl-CoA carboxylase carboxyl transferase subunit alpha